jgi:hypothetical protein
MWTPEDVSERFIEAADVEYRMLVKGMTRGGNAWPSYAYTREDYEGWDDAARADNLANWQGRKVTRSPEISRWEEVFFVWTNRYIPDLRARQTVWTWAHCMAHGPSFVFVCEKRGWVRRTEYARKERTFADLAETLRNNDVLFRPAEQIPLAQQTDVLARNGDKVGASRDRSQHPPFRSESPRHLLTSDAAIAEFEQHLADENEKRRKARLRKSLRGVPGGETETV